MLNPLLPVRMMFSAHTGWDEAARRHPSVRSTFLYRTLPWSLLASAMVWQALGQHAAAYDSHLDAFGVNMVALSFMLTCWVGSWLMAQFTRTVVSTERPPALAECYHLVVLASWPVWLSSLSLLLPLPWFNALAALAGLWGSLSLLYHGLDGWYEHNDSTNTLFKAYVVMVVGALLWTAVAATLLLVIS
ncbi:MAG: DUF1282 family protein [Aquitalea sp.]|nr:DUF1282 family protein [Aquitalea sp.]